MKKRNLIVVSLVIIVLIAGAAYYQFSYRVQHSPIYIAVMVPGEDAVATSTNRAKTAIEMYINDVNAQGGANGHPIRLIYKEDKNTPEGAQQALDEIYQEGKAVAILGNIYSGPAIAIGDRLQSYEIPAITAGATAPDVTRGNPWFFRVIPDNISQGEFIAGYAVYVLGYKNAVIVSENNVYGETLGAGFEQSFKSYGGEIYGNYTINNGGDIFEEAEAIVHKIDEMPDVIFLATYKASGAALIKYAREHGIDVPIMGGDDIGDRLFVSKFDDFEQSPGFYSDNVYAASPLIFDIAGDRAQDFWDRYQIKAGEYPTWFAATSYDSAVVIIQAIKDAKIEGNPDQLAAERKKVRDQLQAYNHGNYVEGITGALFFDENHNAARPMSMGIFSNERFISAPIQLTAIYNSAFQNNYDDARATQDAVFLGNVLCYKTKIVYAGIDINEFPTIDIDDSHTFTADFYLWFRYNGEINADNIKFENVTDIEGLDEPIKEEYFSDSNTTYRLYRVIATFSGSYDLSDYPFDNQTLDLSFRHADRNRNEILYVPDILGMGDVSSVDFVLNSLEQARAFNAVNDWFPVNGRYFQDIIYEYTTRGDPRLFGQKINIQYSRYNAEFIIERDILSFSAKTMLPVFFLIVLAYLGFFLPGKQFETITGIMTGTVLSVVFFHVDLSSRLNVGYTVTLDYLFYGTYILLIAELLLSVIAWHKENDEETTKKLFLVMRVLYPLFVIAGLVAAILIYKVDLLHLIR